MVESPERIGVAVRPPFEASAPRVLFPLDADLADWHLEGEAFSIAGAFGVTTLNSHAAAGETATGRAISPSFTVGEHMRSLVFQMQGGSALAEDGPGALDVRLVDAETGEVLERYTGPGTHVMGEIRVPLESHRGRTVQMEVVDGNSGTTSAWIGIGGVAVIEEMAPPAQAAQDMGSRTRSPIPLFNLNQPDNLEGWTQSGKTFSVCRVADQWSLNSKNAAGADGVGTITSPSFILEGDFLKFLIHGGGSAVDEGPGALNIALVDAESREVLVRVFAPAPGQRIFHRIQIPIAAWQGREVQLVVRDEAPGGGLGWIGIRDVVLSEK